jgi:hypothetical protein
VPRSDSRSFKIANPDAVADTRQVLTNVVSAKGEDSRDVFKDAKTRHNVGDNPENVSPEIAVVILSSAPSRQTDGLARGSAENNVNCSNILTSQGFHILENRHARPVLAKNRPAERILFAHGDHAPALRLEGQVNPADPREQRERGHAHAFSGSGNNTAPISRKASRVHVHSV